MTAPFTAIEPAEFPWFEYRGFTFSLGLQLDGHAIDSGHSGSAFDPQKGRPGVVGDMAAQARTSYAKHAAILAGAGLTLADATRVVENVTVAGLEHYPLAQQVRRETFGDHAPCVSTVIIDRLVRRQALIEIEVHASPGAGEALVVGDDTTWRRETVRTGHDGEVYLPTLLPVDEHGAVVAPGDLAGQYAYCLQRADQLLQRAGLSLAHVVSTADYTTPAAGRDRTGIDAVRRALLGPVFPSATSVVMERLHEPGVLVALEVVASRHQHHAVNPGWARYDTLTYSPGTRAGNTLYLSGFTGIDQQTGEPVHAGDLAGQAGVAYDSMAKVLAAVGATPADLLTTIEYVTAAGLGTYREVAGVRETALSAPYPASTGIVCGGLGRDELLLGVQATAVIPAAS